MLQANDFATLPFYLYIEDPIYEQAGNSVLIIILDPDLALFIPNTKGSHKKVILSGQTQR